jgi:hypothetical protein
MSGCADSAYVNEAKHWALIDQVVDQAKVEFDKKHYVVEFVPLFSGPGEHSDMLVGETVIIEDSGIPAVMVYRSDSTPLGRGDFKLAAMVADKACADKPNWSIRKSPDTQEKYGPTYVNYLGYTKGTGALSKGKWTLYEACE